MAISLEELKRQREQIQKHLAWLDAKIGELTTETQTLDREKQTNTSLPKEAELHAPAAQQVSQAPEQADRPEALQPEIDLPVYKATTQSDLKRAKIGCLALFFLGIALFLFLLFWLPYLL